MPEIKERPILFSAPMVRAILEDRKTVTRRAVKGFQIPTEDTAIPIGDRQRWSAIGQRDPCYGFCVFGSTEAECAKELEVYAPCPQRKPGDRLWVREPWARIRVAQAPDAMKLTEKQQLVLEELRKIGRKNAHLYRDTQPYLHQKDCEKLAQGDQACVFGMGGLTDQIGHRLGLSAPSVLSIFKALRRKGLVIREESYPHYQRARYWWPVGLAAELHAELQAAERVTP